MSHYQIISVGNKYREVIADDRNGNKVTKHEEWNGREWVARFTHKSYNK